MRPLHLYISIIAFALGIFVAEFFSLSYIHVFFLGVLLCGIVSYVYIADHKRIILFVSLILFLFLCGAGRLLYFERITGDALFDTYIDTDVLVEGVIVGEPDIRDNTTHIVVALDTLSLDGIDTTIATKALITTEQYTPYSYGERIRLMGTVQKPQAFESENGRVFNYPKFLAKDRIFYTMFLPQIEKKGEGEGNILLAPLFAFKYAVIENVGRIIPEPYSSLAGGLVFGAKSSLGERLLDAFRRTGIIHIVVLSGYNVTIVALGLMYVFGFLSRRSRSVLGIVAIALFALMTGAGATIVRASIMAILVIIAHSIGQKADMTHFLFIAGFFMLLHNPSILTHDPSFQLSFLATFGLLHVSPSVERLVGFVPQWLSLREVFTATLATQIFVLPALLYMTGEISVVALFVNILVLPAIPLTMLFGFLTGMIGFVSVTLSWIPGFIAFFLLAYEITIVRLFNAIPFASIKIPFIPLWVVLLFYGCAVVFFLLKGSAHYSAPTSE